MFSRLSIHCVFSSLLIKLFHLIGFPRNVAAFILFLQLQNSHSLWSSLNPEFPVLPVFQSWIFQNCLNVDSVPAVPDFPVFQPLELSESIHSVLAVPDLPGCKSQPSCLSNLVSALIMFTQCCYLLSQPLLFLPLYYFSCPLFVDACGHSYVLSIGFPVCLFSQCV